MRPIMCAVQQFYNTRIFKNQFYLNCLEMQVFQNIQIQAMIVFVKQPPKKYFKSRIKFYFLKTYKVKKERKIAMKHPSYRYSQLKGQNPTYPPQIQYHYTQHESSHLFICKYCKQQFLLKSASSIEEMIWHTQSLHQKQASSVILETKSGPSGKRYTLQEKLDNLKPPPKYLFKYENMDIISDRWLDRLILYGYPVSEIMDNVYKRLSIDSEQYLINSEKRSISLLNSKDKVIHRLHQLPLYYLPQQSMDYLTKRYKISREACKLLLMKYTWSYKNTPHIYQALADLNVRMKALRQGDHDSCVVFATPRMRHLYLKYGEAVNLQFKFVPVKRAYNGMHYNMGLFIGQDRGVRMVIFAMVLINGYNYKTIKASIKYFLEIMESKQPRILITNHEQIYERIIGQINSEMRVSMKHMVNWYYGIEKLRVNLVNEVSYEQCITKLISAMSTPSMQEYQTILHDLNTSKNLSEEKLQQFQQESAKYCFAKGKPLFVGFGVQEERIGLIAKLVNDSFFYVTRVGMFYSLAFRLEEKCNSTVQQFEKNSDERPAQHKVAQMRYLSTILETNVYTKLSYLYNHSLRKLHIQSGNPEKTSFKIRDSSKTPSNNTYDVTYDLGSGCWHCSCTLIYWSGLPCEHLIKIVRYFRGSISYYINTRWIKTGTLKDVPKFEADEDDNSGTYKADKKNPPHKKQIINSQSDELPKINKQLSKDQGPSLKTNNDPVQVKLQMVYEGKNPQKQNGCNLKQQKSESPQTIQKSEIKEQNNNC